MSSTYCKVRFNWKSEHEGNVAQDRAANVITYSFVDIDSSDYDNISFENRINAQDTISLQFYKQENDESFETNVSCNNPEFSQIDGLSIDSESKILEISNDQEGYMKTVRGRKLIHESGSKAADDSDHFVCTCSFEKPYSSLSVKLLSLGKKDSVQIRSITINIRQHNLDHTSSYTKSTFDMLKLKKDIEDMGDSVSDKALDFLATMESFEKNKMSSFGSLFGQSARMSMQPSAGQNGISSLMRTVLGDETMKSLAQDVAQKGCGETDEQDNIYNMLQAVCGRVAATRTRTPSNHPKEDPPPDTGDLDSSASNMKPMNGQIQGINTSSMLMDIFNQKLDEAKQDMRQEIQIVKTEVTNHIDGVKREIMEQLSNITLLLQGLQASSGTSHCVQNE